MYLRSWEIFFSIFTHTTYECREMDERFVIKTDVAFLKSRMHILVPTVSQTGKKLSRLAGTETDL